MAQRIPVVIAVLLAALAVALANHAHSAPAVTPTQSFTAGTAFTYQGRLQSGAGAVNGLCDFEASLWAAATTGPQIGTTQQVPAQPVTAGLFTVLLDFGGDAFTGDARWLQIAVRCPAGTGSFTVLAPRQLLTPAPYALFASQADRAAVANSVHWTDVLSRPPGLDDGDNVITYSAGNGLNLSGTQFAVDTAAIQARVSGTCVAGDTIQQVNADGSVVCAMARPQGYYPLASPQAVNMAATDATISGFQGGFTDGRYAYFVPFTYSKVARLDTQNFGAGGLATLDLASVDATLKGFEGGFTDGRYGYLIPYNNGSPFGKVVRIDLQNFTGSGVTVLDLTTVDPLLKGFSGGFTDGRYAYVVPYINSKLARIDLRNFTTGGVTVLDLASFDSGLHGFGSGFTDGRYGYLVPLYNGNYFGKVVRLDLQNFGSGVDILNLATADPDLRGFASGFTDGRYGYFVPRYNGAYFGKVARVDLQTFATSSVTVINLEAIDPALKGFQGGFTDGRYGYIVPTINGTPMTGHLVRIDLQNFSAAGVTMLDLTTIDPLLKGFAGGFSDGKYGYLVPYYHGAAFSGRVGRIQLFFGGGF